MKIGRIYTIISVIVTLALAAGYTYIKISGKEPIDPTGTVSRSKNCDIRPEDHIVLDIYNEALFPLDIKPGTPEYSFRTVIEKGYQETGINFNGHYSVTSWGCGTSCQESAIIDATTGKVVKFKVRSEYGISVKPNSSLLMVNATENLPDSQIMTNKDIKTSYYKMIDGNLVLICEEPAYER
ncbi:MAG: hypothetical protein PHG66_02880 [Candidatus Colwellbacteria bacterium]|nr:hypothetical protein [Candidatus Colwellbacteria bacterium]